MLSCSAELRILVKQVQYQRTTVHVLQVRCGTSILALPLDLLAEVLQHLDQRDRLICCALVSKSWHQAANIATSWVEIDLEAAAGQGLAQTGSLSAWLRSNKYASNIRYIRVWQKPTDAPSISVLQVCCQQLKGLEELELAFCQLKTVTASVQSYAPPSLGVTSAEQTTAACAPQAEVAAGFESPARESRNLGALTALTSLDLLQTCLDLDELSSCTGLQYLALCDVTHGSTPPTTEFDPAAAESKVQPAVSPTTVIPPQIAFALSRLTQLRHLHIGYTFKMEEEQQQQQEASAVYASFGSLPNLQNLWLGVDTTEVEDLSQIPVCLTTLRISGISLALTVDTMPKLPLMTTLEELHIVGIPSFDALLLASLTRLTWLCMCIVDAPVDADGLLTSLQQLKHMRLLKLHGCLEEDCTDMEKYAALTVSSQLEELHLPTCQIPPEAFEYVFAHSMIRKMLTSIVVSSDFLGSAGNCERLVACSPALREFGIADSPGIPGWASLIDVQVGLSLVPDQHKAVHNG